MISLREPIVELIMGIFSWLIYLRFGLNYSFVVVFLLTMLLFIIALIDIETMMIYDVLLLCCVIVICFSYHIFPVSFCERMIGLLIVSFPLILLNLFVKECFGGGDIKLLAIFGFFLGYKSILLSMIIATLLASLNALFMIIYQKSCFQDYIPFGPYLSFSLFIVMLYGHQIQYFYFSFF